MDQLPFPALSRLRIEPRNLLPAGMEITSYNHHCEGSFLPSVFLLKQRLPGQSSLRSYPINSTDRKWTATCPSSIRRATLKHVCPDFPSRPITVLVHAVDIDRVRSSQILPRVYHR